MKKRLLCLVMILGLSVTACGVDADFTLNKDKTYNLATTVYYNESEINQLSSTDDFNINDFKKVKIDGKTYYKSDSELESGKCSDNEGWYVTDDKVALP